MIYNLHFKNLMLYVLFLLISVPLLAGAAGADIEILAAKLESKDPAVRMSAVGALGMISDSRAVGLLIKVVTDIDEDWKIRIAAIRRLHKTGDTSAVDSLIYCLFDPCPAIKWNAASALGVFKGHSRVIDALTYAIDDKTLYVREAIIQSLGEIGDPSGVPYIIPELKSASFAVRFSAVKALGKIGDPRAVPFLEQIERNEKDPVIRNEARSSLSLIPEQHRTTRR